MIGCKPCYSCRFKFGDSINCLEVEIWVEQSLSEDGRQRRWNATNAAVIVKDVFTKIFSAVHRKNAR